jgi:acetolactate synthase I/II/III large subunit
VATHDDESTRSVGRRNFLKGAAAGAASALATGAAVAQQTTPAASRSNATRPTESDARADFVPPEPNPGAPLIETPGSDHMLDVLKLLNFDYVAVNPGSAFEGIHESIINHGGNRKPEILTVLHEEAGAAMAHGYAKAAGKPMMTLMHGTVGLLHASMGLFQAWADRVPVFATVGHTKNPTGTVNRPHSAQDMGSIVRDFVKMDEEPSDLEHFAESALRLYTVGRTPPMGPTLLTISAELQESAIPDASKLRVPTSLTMPSPPQGDGNAVREAARWLAGAERPLIRLGKLGRTSAGWDLAIELAELLQAPVDVGTYGSWQDFPSWHALYGSGGPDYKPDVVLGLELNDLSASVRAMRGSGGKTISICSEYLFQGHNIHDFAGYQEVDLAIAGDGETTLPQLIEEIRRVSGKDMPRLRQARGAQISTAHKTIRDRELDTARYGWNANPVSVPRMIAELARQVLRHRLRHARVGGRRARAPRARPAADRDRRGRRFQLRRRRRALDRGAPQDSVAPRDPQQSRLSCGSHARAARRESARPRHRSDRHRQRHPRSGTRLRDDREGLRRVFGRADQRPEHARTRLRTRPRARSRGRAGARRRRFPAALSRSP